MTTTPPSPEEGQDRLDALQDKIDEIRADANDGTELDTERRFIDDGDLSEDVDNTIAPSRLTVDVAPGTLVVFADLGCPWAGVGLHRLHAASARLGLADAAVDVDIRVFPLELVNAQPTPFKGLQAEIPVMARLTPDAGWQPWSADPTTWPVTTLPAMEAVEAAKEQSLAASAQLDMELRRAWFARSECISMRHVILQVAARCDRVDVDALAEAIDDGRARRSMLDGYRSVAEEVRGSPHVFLPDGTSVHNPGIEFHWDKRARDFVIDADDPGVYDDLLQRAAASR